MSQLSSIFTQLIRCLKGYILSSNINRPIQHLSLHITFQNLPSYITFQNLPSYIKYGQNVNPYIQFFPMNSEPYPIYDIESKILNMDNMLESGIFNIQELNYYYSLTKDLERIDSPIITQFISKLHQCHNKVDSSQF